MDDVTLNDLRSLHQIVKSNDLYLKSRVEIA